MKQIAFALSVMLALGACTVSFQPGAQANLPKPTAATPAQQAAAVGAARDYLALIEAKRFEALWQRAGPALKASTSHFVFINAVKLAQGTLGVKAKRSLDGVAFSTQIDANAPVGEYAVVQFKSRAGHVTATEKMVMQKEGGARKIVGYFVTKLATYNANG